MSEATNDVHPMQFWNMAYQSPPVQASLRSAIPLPAALAKWNWTKFQTSKEAHQPWIVFFQYPTIRSLKTFSVSKKNTFKSSEHFKRKSSGSIFYPASLKSSWHCPRSTGKLRPEPPTAATASWAKALNVLRPRAPRRSAGPRRHIRHRWKRKLKAAESSWKLFLSCFEFASDKSN